MIHKIYTQGDYLIHNPTWHEEDAPWKSRQILKIIERNNVSPKTIAEVGCGSGEIIKQLSLKMSPKISFSGYELSPQAFALCQPKTNDRLHYHLKDLLQEDKSFFDLVLAIDVFEHVEDYFGFLKKLRTKGTYKIFHIPLDLSVQTVLRGYPLLRERRDVGHLHYFTKETALATLKDTGYKIIDSFYTASSLDLSAKSFKSRLIRLPRKILFGLNQDLAVRLLGGYSLMVLTK